MAGSKLKQWLVVWGIASPVLAFLFGSGAIWEWRSSQLAQKNFDLEKSLKEQAASLAEKNFDLEKALKEQEADLAKKSFEMESAIKKSTIRSQLIQVFGQIVDLSDQYIKLRDLAAQNNAPALEIPKKINTCRGTLQLLKDQYAELEKSLAQLENRAPQPTPEIDFTPPAAITDLH
jgi:hypothetical protein